MKSSVCEISHVIINYNSSSSMICTKYSIDTRDNDNNKQCRGWEGGKGGGGDNTLQKYIKPFQAHTSHLSVSVLSLQLSPMSLFGQSYYCCK